MTGSAEEGRPRSLSPTRRLSRSPERGPSRRLSRSWSPPSPPQAKEEKMSLYLFFDHGAEEISLSLFTVEIPSAHSSSPLPPIPIRIVPTLLFRTTDFPTSMHCVHLGSKFYFLGGEISGSLDDLEYLTRDDIYPPNVYIFDTATDTANSNSNSNDAKDLVTSGPPMKTGKPSRLYLFVACSKIYVLSCPLGMAFHKLDGLEYFEVFDPNTEDWTPLPRPTFRDHILQDHAVMKNKVYILARTFRPSPQFSLFCFDLNNNQWLPPMPFLSSQLNCPRIRLSALMADIVEDSLYGFGFSRNGYLLALGPLKATEVADGQCFNHLIHILPVNMSLSWNTWGKLLHLGNRRFCYVNCAEAFVSDIDDAINDPQTLYISLTIFEALTDTFANQDGDTCSKAKVLLPALFVAKFPSDADLADLCNCSLLPIAANDAGFNGEAQL